MLPTELEGRTRQPLGLTRETVPGPVTLKIPEGSGRPRLQAFGGYLLLLTVVFVQPLAQLIQYALKTDLHSHVPLVPAVAGYLLYTRRRTPRPEYRAAVTGAFATGVLGLLAVAAALVWREALSLNDYLALMALAFVSLVAAGCFLFLGATWMRATAFPVAFLVFMVPLPDALVNWLERASALASAEAAAFYFGVAGTALVRDGTTFELPGIVLQVAQECSGIRSSWALFITSVLAAHLFLKSHWRRFAIVAFVIPLGILRNGFRVFVIGVLCVHVGPHMIESPIHRQGGPLFFALSLIPLFLALGWLRRQERRENRRAEKS